MSLSATMAVALPWDHRMARRRIVNLKGFSRLTGVRLVPVSVANLTAAGCRLTTSEPVEPDTFVWVKIAGLAPHRARLEHWEGEHYRCEFVPPVQAGVVDDLLAAQERKRKRDLKASGRTLFR